MRPTRKDVAELAKVSTATVSYVLNDSRSVPQATRKKVLDAVAELNYRPDYIARTMVTKRTQQLSVVLNNIANPIYGDLILGFEKEAIDYHYFVNICTGYKNVDDYFERFIARRIDGIFIEVMPYKFHLERIDELVAASIKVVVFGHVGQDLRRVSSIENDYEDAMEQAVAHLYNLGHRDIIYISGLARQDEYDFRIRGFSKALERRGISPEKNIVAPDKATNTEVNDGYRLCRDFLQSKQAVSAVICTNDFMAVGAMRAIKEAGFSIPKDVSLMGIDNAYIGEIVDPSLTTLAADYQLLGNRAFHLLYQDMQHDTKGFFCNQLSLIPRSSTGPFRGG
jgi:DNA-binding LacI/PurR family transcriptional regulator